MSLRSNVQISRWILYTVLIYSHSLNLHSNFRISPLSRSGHCCSLLLPQAKFNLYIGTKKQPLKGSSWGLPLFRLVTPVRKDIRWHWEELDGCLTLDSGNGSLRISPLFQKAYYAPPSNLVCEKLSCAATGSTIQITSISSMASYTGHANVYKL